MNKDSAPDTIALREELEDHIASGTPLEVIYFGGGLPGAERTVTPLRYCEERGRDYLIGLCHRSGIEKTFRLDRMHLPVAPLADGKNDFRSLAQYLGNASMIEGVLAKVARLGNLPMENALAAHLAQGGGFESFFDEYSYGGYTLELKITSTVIYLSLGYEANEVETMHYEFTPDSEPRLMPGPAMNTPAVDPASKYQTFTEIKRTQSEPGPLMEYPLPETTPGVFLEHFDLSWPLGDGRDGIIYGYLFKAAKEAAAEAGWTFRSYSSFETPGADEDWLRRQIRAFPTLILYRDGVELGRHTYVNNTVSGILSWGNKLLGMPGEDDDGPPPRVLSQ